MELTELVWSMQLPILEQFTWDAHKIEKGLLPETVQAFHNERVSKHLTAGLKIHKDHSFYPGELVAVIKKGKHKNNFRSVFWNHSKKVRQNIHDLSSKARKGSIQPPGP